jgi:hypothetical protein
MQEAMPETMNGTMQEAMQALTRRTHEAPMQEAFGETPPRNEEGRVVAGR